MTSQANEKLIHSSSRQFGCLTQLLLLAITVLIYNVIAIAIANSLFVSQVGAGELPLAFILIGLSSFPAYGAFSQIADRYSRPQIFRYVLLASILIVLGLRVLISLDVPWVYYVLLITIFFQWDFNNNILYPGLLTDYFTTLEYKKYAPFIGIAQAVGTLLGGGLTTLLAHYFPSRELLLALPVFMAIAWGQLTYLESSQCRLETPPLESNKSILESLKIIPDLVKKYPLVLFLGISTFLLVIIYLGAEFLWFNIYSQHFNESELTEFLGLMRMVNAVIQVMLLYGITRPLLRWLGVARLNAVYPLTTLVSLSGLLINFNLPAAIALHINGDALYKAINLPIHQLNYNGIPHQYVGRIRALSDGLIYSLGLTLAGVGLWLFHLYCNLEQITWLAIGFSFVLLLVRLPMGRFYAQSLEEMIRSDTINLDDFTDAKTFLPPQSSKVIQEFLCSDDQMTIAKGLELAASLGNYKQFLPEVQAKLADSSLRPHIVKLLRQGLNADNLQQLANLLTATDSNIRATALEILLVNQYSFQPEKLELLINDSDKQIRTLARVAALVNNSAKIDSSLANQLVPTEITETTAQAIARIVNYSQNPKLISVIKYLLPQASPATKQLSLNALANLAQPQDKHLAQIAAVFTNHSEPAVRIAAFKLLEITRCAAMLETVTTGLNDDNPQVRQQVANTLAAYGETGLAIAQKNLTSSKPEIVNTAITAIAKVKSKQKDEILYKHLMPEFQHLNLTRKWQKQIPTSNPSWQLLSVALEDYQKRLLQKVLYILSCLGYSRTVSLVQRILATNERRDLANAIEVLASINHRRFIQPLIPLLEKYVAQPSTIKIEPTPTWLRNKGYKILLEALESRDRWIKTGASIALTMIPTALLKDPDPIVQSVAKEIFPTQLTSHVSISMNQLLLLRKVALFKNLSLDELFSLNQALESRRVLAGETIYTEGSWGWHLYIIAEGRIQIVKEVDGKTQEIKQLTPGEYFGEIALFDEAPRWDGAIALEDSRLLSLEKKRFISLIAQRPHIILEICRFLSKRLRETDKYLSAQKMPASTAQMTNYQSLQQALDS